MFLNFLIALYFKPFYELFTAKEWRFFVAYLSEISALWQQQWLCYNQANASFHSGSTVSLLQFGITDDEGGRVILGMLVVQCNVQVCTRTQ